MRIAFDIWVKCFDTVLTYSCPSIVNITSTIQITWGDLQKMIAFMKWSGSGSASYSLRFWSNLVFLGSLELLVDWP